MDTIEVLIDESPDGDASIHSKLLEMVGTWPILVYQCPTNGH